MIRQQPPKSHLSQWIDAERELTIKGFLPSPPAIYPITDTTTKNETMTQPQVDEIEINKTPVTLN